MQVIREEEFTADCADDAEIGFNAERQRYAERRGVLREKRESYGFNIRHDASILTPLMVVLGRMSL